MGFRKQLFGRPAGTREEACEAHGRGHRKLSRSASTDTPTQPGVVSSGRFKPLEAVFAAKFGYAAAQPRQFRPHTAFQIVQHRACLPLRKTGDHRHRAVGAWAKADGAHHR